ncbi:hypothetical protein QLX08_002989 [Tetragonisca angustula]|uniref:Reverse transcriptase domain-containing protein n=1 Tax=Tetragonisca angustula TaxID=166442 RepID=A0AAW1A8G5_9HYME
MKKNKAARKDGIRIEFIQGLPEELARVFHEIMQGFWSEGRIHENWTLSRIFLIHKAEDENDVRNYRVMALLYVGYKILTSVMARRLRRWLENNKVLGESQCGFRSKTATRDDLFALNSLIGNKLRRKGGKLYAAFVDFRTAFDTVNRWKMKGKLKRMGISGRMLDMIKSIYRETTSEVITLKGRNRRFKTDRGVRQGCPLSPILFNMYIDLEKEMKEGNLGGTVIGKTKVFALKYADDVALVADDAMGLKEMLASLARFAAKEDLQINTDKTKIMVFRKGGRRSKKERWWINGREIEVVNSFKYLGFWFTTGNAYSKHLEDLAARTRIAANAAWGGMRRARIGGLKRRLYIYDVLCKSILSYGIEIWGWKERSEIERMSGRMCKMAMGLSRNTPDYIWRMEAGREKVETGARRRAGNYLVSIAKMKEERLPKVCLREEVRNWKNGRPSSWMSELEAAMKEVGDGEILGMLEGKEGWNSLERKLKDGWETRRNQITQRDWCKINRSRYCPDYKDLKTDWTQESYWEDKETSWKDKEQWARMQCGNIGRAGNKGFKEENCRLCGTGKENLDHAWSCEGMRSTTKEELVRKVEAEWGKVKEEGMAG